MAVHDMSLPTSKCRCKASSIMLIFDANFNTKFHRCKCKIPNSNVNANASARFQCQFQCQYQCQCQISMPVQIPTSEQTNKKSNLLCPQRHSSGHQSKHSSDHCRRQQQATETSPNSSITWAPILKTQQPYFFPSFFSLFSSFFFLSVVPFFSLFSPSSPFLFAGGSSPLQAKLFFFSFSFSLSLSLSLSLFHFSFPCKQSIPTNKSKTNNEQDRQIDTNENGLNPL